MAKKTKRQADPDLLARLWSQLMLTWRLLLDRRVSGSSKLIPLIMVAYILSPIDLMPDVLLPFGVVDDIGAFLLGLQMFIQSAPSDVVEEYRQGKSRQKAEGTFQAQDDGPPVIEGSYYVRDDNEE